MATTDWHRVQNLIKNFLAFCPKLFNLVGLATPAMEIGKKLLPSVKIGADCVICEDTEIKGNVTIGNGTIIHPRVSIIAESGPIIIGEFNLFEEKSFIINKATNSSSGATPVMIIGSYNVFEVASHSEALKVGDNNIFEPKSYVGREVVVTDACVIGAGCHLTGEEVLSKQTAVSGLNCLRSQTSGHPTQVLQMQSLAKTLPLYNAVHKRKSVK